MHQQVSLAAGWTGRRTPSILDVGHASLLMWDGRFDSLQRQVLGVIESPLEANSSRLYFAQEIARRYSAPYEEIFGSDPTVVLGDDYPQLTGDTTGCQLELTSFTTPDAECSEGTLHGVPGDGAEYDSLTDEQQRTVTRIAMNAGKAIAAYERLLSCGTSRFDDFMHGDEDALDESEQRGAALFVGKADCVSCHSGGVRGFVEVAAFIRCGIRAAARRRSNTCRPPPARCEAGLRTFEPSGTRCTSCDLSEVPVRTTGAGRPNPFPERVSGKCNFMVACPRTLR